MRIITVLWSFGWWCTCTCVCIGSQWKMHIFLWLWSECLGTTAFLCSLIKNKIFWTQSVGAALCGTVRQATGKISHNLSLTKLRGWLGCEDRHQGSGRYGSMWPSANGAGAGFSCSADSGKDRAAGWYGLVLPYQSFFLVLIPNMFAVWWAYVPEKSLIRCLDLVFILQISFIESWQLSTRFKPYKLSMNVDILLWETIHV